VHALIPFHGAGGFGGCQRSAPTGGAAKGMPLNTLMPSCAYPFTLPNRVVATVDCADSRQDNNKPIKKKKAPVFRIFMDVIFLQR
jgi:hypothetical protein